MFFTINSNINTDELVWEIMLNIKLYETKMSKIRNSWKFNSVGTDDSFLLCLEYQK